MSIPPIANRQSPIANPAKLSPHDDVFHDMCFTIGSCISPDFWQISACFMICMWTRTGTGTVPVQGTKNETFTTNEPPNKQTDRQTNIDPGETGTICFTISWQTREFHDMFVWPQQVTICFPTKKCKNKDCLEAGLQS